MPRSGVVGEQIYEQVEQLVQQGMNKQEAFQRIADESGRQRPTVAANYYRVARKRAGGSLRPRGRSGATRGRRASSAGTSQTSGTRARRGAAASDGDIERIAASLVENVQALANAVNAQSAELRDLRGRFDQARRLFGT